MRSSFQRLQQTDNIIFRMLIAVGTNIIDRCRTHAQNKSDENEGIGTGAALKDGVGAGANCWLDAKRSEANESDAVGAAPKADCGAGAAPRGSGANRSGANEGVEVTAAPKDGVGTGTASS